MLNHSTVDTFSAKMAQSPDPEIDVKSMALLVVDMVNDYLLADGAMPVDESGPLIRKTQELVAASRDTKAEVIWVRPGHTQPNDGLFRKRIVHAVEGTPGGEIHPDLRPMNGEKGVKKRRYSAFFGTDLDMYLREHGIKSVLVCGVALNICVRSTVQDAFFLGYDVFVVEDASKATGERERQSTLYDLETHFATIKSVDEVKTVIGRRRDLA